MDRVGRDARLVVRAQLGDRAALAELVGHWRGPVWRYVLRMLEQPALADDVSQEAWAAALKALPRLKQPDRFAPWLFTITRRMVTNHLREKYGRPEQLDDWDPAGIDDEAAAVLDRAQVAEGLAGLAPPEREVLILFYLQDLSIDECASVLDVPTGTVKSRLFRARTLLRGQLARKGYTT